MRIILGVEGREEAAKQNEVCQAKTAPSGKRMILPIKKMDKTIKYIIFGGISLVIVGLSVGGGYWLGYSAEWDKGSKVGYLDGYNRGYRVAFADGKVVGNKEGNQYGFLKGINDAKVFVIEHTKGKMIWQDQ